MSIAMFFVLLLAWCLLFARLEAEIEGENGWAEKLPTARYRKMPGTILHRPFAGSDLDWKSIDSHSFKGKFFSAYIGILGGKDFTTYHRIVDLIQLFVAHLLVYHFFKTDSLIVLEVRALATLMLIWSLEDTLYFFVNPMFGFKKYNPESIGWHKDWVQIRGVRIGDKGMMMLLLQGSVLMILSFFLTPIWHWLANALGL